MESVRIAPLFVRWHFLATGLAHNRALASQEFLSSTHVSVSGAFVASPRGTMARAAKSWWCSSFVGVSGVSLVPT